MDFCEEVVVFFEAKPGASMCTAPVGELTSRWFTSAAALELPASLLRFGEWSTLEKAVIWR